MVKNLNVHEAMEVSTKAEEASIDQRFARAESVMIGKPPSQAPVPPDTNLSTAKEIKNIVPPAPHPRGYLTLGGDDGTNLPFALTAETLDEVFAGEKVAESIRIPVEVREFMIYLASSYNLKRKAGKTRTRADYFLIALRDFIEKARADNLGKNKS